MNDAIIVALITGACAVVSQIIISAKSTKELYSKLELADEKIKGELGVIHTELGNLREQVEKHNNMVERTYKLEQEVALLKAANAER